MANQTKTRTPDYRDYLLDNPRVHPKARTLFRAVLKELREAGYPAVVVEVYRSPERQRALYAQGRSDAVLSAKGYTQAEILKYRQMGYTSDKRVVTKVLSAGKHSQGRAMDIAWLIDGQLSWNAPEAWWEMYGQIAKKHGLTWGGDWKFKDRPHCEYNGE